MRILITGSNGFIGNHLANSFVEDGWNDVYCTERKWTAGADRPSLPHVFVDLTVREDVEETITALSPDVIFHCAAHANVLYSVENPEYDAQANTIGTINLIESAKTSGVEKIIYSSSGGCTYGEQQTKLPMREDHPTNPICPYGFSKWSGEQYLKLLNFPNYCILRYSNVYGKNCRGILRYFHECWEYGTKPIIYGTGDDTTRDYIHVNDVVSANRFSLKNDLQGIYNVSTGVSMTLNQLWEEFVCVNIEYGQQIHELLNKYLVYEDLRDGECINNVLSSEKLQSEGWKWENDIANGLKLGL
jgi:UDP-glucose 4-epimerase